jgi:hypothetical protein
MAAEDRHEEVFTDEECIDCTERERSFDTLTRGLANGSISRRKALRVLGASLVGSVLAAIPGAAIAKPPPGTCLKEGKPCKTNTDCCSQNCETRKGKLVCGPALQCTGSGQGNCPQPANQCLQVLCANGFCGAAQAKPNGTGCNDGNPCTVGETCQGGVCTGGAANACNDNDPCTVDTCNPQTGCIHTEIPNCCRNDSDCQDGNPCTTNTCESNVCVSTGVPDCCQTDADCDDNNACTTETCDTTTNTCVFTAVVCNDNDPCTVDTCVPETGCVYTELPGCCRNDSDCQDGNPCTTDTCNQTTNTCVFTPITGCVTCTTNGDCPQPANQCQQVVCTAGVCSAAQNKPNGTACNDNNACTTGETCQGGACTGGTPVTCTSQGGQPRICCPTGSTTCTPGSCCRATGTACSGNGQCCSSTCGSNNRCT